MTRTAGPRTLDGIPNMRCMAVGLTKEQEDACKNAIVPVPVMRVGNVADACRSMSTVLPLVVIVDESISDADRDALAEFTTACGAELFVIERTPGKEHAKGLFEALLIAERRRMGGARL